MSGPRSVRLWLCAVLLCAAGCSTWSYLCYRVSPDYPRDATERLDLPGLTAPALVYFDALGVPHVEAKDELDLVRAVGFLHGRARFFQMDVLRRYACGRLAELVGDQEVMLGSTVAMDTTMRGWGFADASRAEADALAGELKPLMDAYVAGVNAALERFEPVEYRLLGVEPEPWTVADSFAASLLVGWGITHNWQQETCRLLLALSVGYERAEQILPPEPWPGPASLQADAPVHELPPSVVPELRSMFPPRVPSGAPLQRQAVMAAAGAGLPQVEGASNGWVVGGGLTASGMPIVAGDPHLPHMLPSVMFQQHLRCPGLDVIGVTVPGAPYVLIGHNRDVAWTITAAMADVADLCIEQPLPGDEEQVMGPDGPEPLETRVARVRVREGSTYGERVVCTRHTPRGPVLNDLYPRLLGEGAPLVSVRQTPARVAGTLRSFREANRAGSVGELRQEMMSVVTPASVVVAADRAGDVALFATGTVPVRRGHRGTFPVPAWVRDYQWTEWAGPDDVPHAAAAGESLFAHTNNLLVDPARSDVIFHVDSAPSYRRDRIVQMLGQGARHTAESMAQIQRDVLVLRARRILPAILQDLEGTSFASQTEAQAARLLGQWDCRADADSAACAVFFATYREALIGALQDEVSPEALDFLVSFRYFTNGVDLWFDDPQHPVWDDLGTPEVETRADTVRAAFARGVSRLCQSCGGRDPRRWRWGALHGLHPEHPFGSRLAAFSLPAWEAPGASASVWKAHFDMGDPDEPFRCIYGPVLRMVVDMGDLDHAWWVIDTGSSGWPLSPHYGDQCPLWQEGGLAPMVSDWREIGDSATGVLTLW
jgi:penicillin amidase